MTGEFSNTYSGYNSNFPKSEIEESGLSQIQPIVSHQVAQPTFSKDIKQFSSESQSTCKFHYKQGFRLYMQDHRKGNYRIGLEFGTPNFADMRVQFQVRIFTIIRKNKMRLIQDCLTLI